MLKGNLRSPLVSIVPLSVHIISHVNDVVHELTNVTNGKAFEVPVGGRSGACHRLAGRKSVTNELQERQISLTIVLVTRGDARYIWSSRIFPVKVDAVKPLIFDKLVQQVRTSGTLKLLSYSRSTTHSNHILSKGLSLPIGDSLAKDGSRVCIGREGPPSKRKDPLDLFQAFEIVKSILLARHIDAVGSRNVSECKVLALNVRDPDIHMHICQV